MISFLRDKKFSNLDMDSLSISCFDAYIFKYPAERNVLKDAFTLFANLLTSLRKAFCSLVIPRSFKLER